MPPYAGPPVASRQGDASSTLRLLAYLALAITLIVLDNQGGWLSRLRVQASLVVQPIWSLAGLPGRLGATVKDNAASHGQLVSENRELRNQLLVANARLTRLQTAALDNAQLRELLNVSERAGLDVQLAPILDIDLDPVKQRLVLDSGSRDGVRVGQAVIDAGGLMGQVIVVTPGHSTVLLLTDPDHAVPVTVARNGVRLIAYGRGDRLELRDIPLSAGVEVGDEIVTSGLGGRFPAGFPVGKILKLRPDDTHAFLVGELEPAAKLDRGRNVLLLRSVASVPQLPVTTGLEPPPLSAAATAAAVPEPGAGLAPSHRPTPDTAQPAAAQTTVPNQVPATTTPEATTPSTVAPTNTAPVAPATTPAQAPSAAPTQVQP